MATKSSTLLESLLKALELALAGKAILESALNNEAERLGLTRAERHELFKRITAETNTITTEDMGDGA